MDAVRGIARCRAGRRTAGPNRRARRGAIGGAIAGVTFEALREAAWFSTDAPLRAIGLVITGAGVGLGVGVVRRMRREAWLTIVGGPMRGKEIILTKRLTTIGSSHRAD